MRWRQCRHTGEFIPIDESARKHDGVAIHGFHESYVSPVDGSIISDAKSLREHNKRNGVVHTAEFSQEFLDRKRQERERHYTGEHTKEEKLRRGQQLNEIINQLERQG